MANFCVSCGIPRHTGKGGGYSRHRELRQAQANGAVCQQTVLCKSLICYFSEHKAILTGQEATKEGVSL